MPAHETPISWISEEVLHWIRTGLKNPNVDYDTSFVQLKGGDMRPWDNDIDK